MNTIEMNVFDDGEFSLGKRQLRIELTQELKDVVTWLHNAVLLLLGDDTKGLIDEPAVGETYWRIDGKKVTLMVDKDGWWFEWWDWDEEVNCWTDRFYVFGKED